MKTCRCLFLGFYLTAKGFFSKMWRKYPAHRPPLRREVSEPDLHAVDQLGKRDALTTLIQVGHHAGLRRDDRYLNAQSPGPTWAKSISKRCALCAAALPNTIVTTIYVPLSIQGANPGFSYLHHQNVRRRGSLRPTTPPYSGRDPETGAAMTPPRHR